MYGNLKLWIILLLAQIGRVSDMFGATCTEAMNRTIHIEKKCTMKYSLHAEGIQDWYP